MASNRNSDGTFKKGSHWRKPKLYWNKKWLLREYVTKQQSAKEIADHAGCSENSIFNWLTKHGIRRRSISEARSIKYWGAQGSANPMFGRCDKANPNWRGGVSPERQKLYARSMWKAIRKAVFSRDNFSCRRCGEKPVGHKQLHTHHLRAWARDPALRFDVDNIITLCRGCHEWIHSKENKNREFLE